MRKAITVTEQQAKHLEEATRDQADSKTWFQYRAGRVTASKFKAAAHTNKSSPSQSLLKTIISKDCHANLKIGCCGLVVHPCYPHLGASPDGIVICDCCGKGVLEIKCPYSCRGKAFSEAADQDKDFCLQKHADGRLQLIESHAYYQVQAQLKLCETVYCDFVMWSMDELLVLQIFPDPEFIDGAIEEVPPFFKYGVLPELLGKWNTMQGPILLQHTDIFRFSWE